MESWADVCKFDDIPRQGSAVACHGTERIAIFRTISDRLFALEDRCPHKGGYLSDGLVHGDFVTCPLHNLIMSLGSGMAVAPDEGCVRRYDVRVSDGMVQVCLAAPSLIPKVPHCAAEGESHALR